jgi:hypothetical protein
MRMELASIGKPVIDTIFPNGIHTGYGQEINIQW